MDLKCFINKSALFALGFAIKYSCLYWFAILLLTGEKRLSEMVVSSVLMMSSDNKFDKVCNFFHSKVASLKAALESKAIGLSHKIANEIALLVCIHTALQSLSIHKSYCKSTFFLQTGWLHKQRKGGLLLWLCIHNFFRFLKERI